MQHIKLKLIVVGLLMLVFMLPSSMAFEKRDVQQTFISIKKFGAKGDGVTDDYKAFLALADYVNTHRGGNIVFPKGTYYIAAYHTKDNSISDIVFKNCTNLFIKGEDAVISVNGKINRTMDHKGSRAWYSRTNAIVPLFFDNCKQLTIQSLEVNGNVSQMTRDKDVAETGGNLIQLMNCQDVRINDVYVHHAQTDGIYINGAASKNFTFLGVTSSNNARQGMSIIKLNNATFTKCKFVKTGITGGTYGFHAPAAGVDIECGKVPLTQKSGNFIFDNCIFAGNQGAQFACTSPVSCSNVTIKNCQITANDAGSSHAMILVADSVTLQDSKIDCKNGNIHTSWKGSPGANVKVIRCDITSSLAGIVAISDDESNDRVVIANNTFYNSGNAEIKKYFIQIQNPKASFTNNVVHIPSHNLKRLGATSLIENARISEGNTFISDGNVKPKVSYKGTLKVLDKL
jgi:hypothetical protein